MSLNIMPIDKLEIIALMDNASDPFTESHPGLRWNESQYRSKILNQKKECGANYCRACNGLSLLLKIHYGNEVKTVLFDTGPDDGLVVNNAKRMAVDLTEVDAIILSHGHFDHYGGTLSVLDAIGKKELPVYIHPNLFAPRRFREGENNYITVSYNLTNQDIERYGGKVIESIEPISLFDNRLVISGEVDRITSYEQGSPGECTHMNGEWVDSPLVIDERILILNLKNKGLCVFTGCGHTGVINASLYSKKLTGMEPIHLLMGGFHLAPTLMQNRIAPTLEDLIKLDPNYIVTGHCTGTKAQSEFTKQFGSKHSSYGVGTVFCFE